MHFGLIVVDPAVEDKLHRKHKGITHRDVVEAVQWPARPQAAWDEDEEHGRRVVALGTNAADRTLICWLQPIPDWDDDADTWTIRTARWV